PETSGQLPAPRLDRFSPAAAESPTRGDRRLRRGDPSGACRRCAAGRELLPPPESGVVGPARFSQGPERCPRGGTAGGEGGGRVFTGVGWVMPSAARRSSPRGQAGR